MLKNLIRNLKSPPKKKLFSVDTSVFMNDLIGFKVKSIWVLICSIAVSGGCALLFDSALEYQPMPQLMMVNGDRVPIGAQNLLETVNYDPRFRTGYTETPEDFLKYALLSMFSFTPEDLSSGRVQDSFFLFCSEDLAQRIYSEQFINLSSPRIVSEQQAIARARLIGDAVYVGESTFPYTSKGANYSVDSLVYKFSGKIMLSVFGQKDYNSVMSYTAIVQRAYIQDKFMGYQIAHFVME